MKKLSLRFTALCLLVSMLMLCFASCGILTEKEPDASSEEDDPYRDNYLIGQLKPRDSHLYGEYAYVGKDSRAMYMGGYSYYGGFKLTTPNITESTERSYAVFDISAYAGKQLSFVMGSASYSGYDDNNYYALVSVRLDGEQVIDENIRAHDVPKRYTLDLTGKSELEFYVREGCNDIYVAELTAWDGEPQITGHTPDTSRSKIQLIKDLLPYMWKYNRAGDDIYTADLPSATLAKFDAIMANLDEFDRKEAIKNQQVQIGGKYYSEVFTSRVNQQISGNDVNSYHFNTEGQYEFLSFSLGTLNIENEKEGSSWVSVYADGERVFEEQVLSDSLPKSYTVNIRHASMIEFEFSYGDGGGHHAAVFDAFVGKTLADVSTHPVPDADHLPDVCKLISAIHPYSVSSGDSEPIYDGSSQHKTFTMAGRTYNEGIILYSKANFLYGNSGAHACFNLEGKFRYLTFKAGLLDKTYCVADDKLEIYLDGNLTETIDLHAMNLPQEYTIDLNYCRELKIKLVGRDTMIRPAYGVANMVVYKNEVDPENAADLFPRESVSYPDEMPLIESIRPYMYYVSANNVSSKDEILYDGSTKQHFFEINGEKKYAGVILQTSVHLDMLGTGSGANTEGIYVTMMGLPFVTGYLAFLAADVLYENSFAAFDLRGEFKTVTFTVAGANPDWSIAGMEQETKLMLGSNDTDKIMETITLTPDMQPTTYTVSIENTEQLIFLLECGTGTSAPYAIYDISVGK